MKKCPLDDKKSPTPMTVMHLLSSLKHDEAERGIYHIAHALHKQGHRCIVVAGAYAHDELVVRLMRDDVIYHRLDIPKKSWLSLRHIPKLAQLINQTRPDIIHVHARTPAWILHWALRFCAYRPKIVSTVYGFYSLNSYSKALFYADIVISASKSIERYLLQSFELSDLEPSDEPSNLPPIVCVRRGVDVRMYPYRYKPSVHWLQHVFAEFGELEHKKWLLFPTMIGAEQGQEWLIDIIGNLKEKYPNLHVIIMDDNDSESLSVASGLIYDEFRQRLGALGLEAYVSFVGKRVPDLKDWLAATHVVLALANQPESIGINVLKAIHLGVPVIGWDKGAYADILADLYPRGLIKNQDAKTLCQTIAMQLETGMRPAMTHAYEVDSMVENTLAVYWQLLA